MRSAVCGVMCLWQSGQYWTLFDFDAKNAYRAKQESSLILHEAAAKALKAAGISKLPNITVLQSKYEKHQEQKEAIYTDYGKLKKQVKEYDVIKQNIDSILRQGKEQEREKEKNMESSFVHICVI